MGSGTNMGIGIGTLIGAGAGIGIGNGEDKDVAGNDVGWNPVEEIGFEIGPVKLEL